MIKTISLWIKNDSKWNILLFIFALWILYVFSVSGDGTNPVNNGYGFSILSLFTITWINILPLCTPTKNKSTIQILEETNNIPITLLMLFLFKTFILYIILLFIWILHSIFNHIPVMILPASLMYWLSSSLSILLYSFCLFFAFQKVNIGEDRHIFLPLFCLHSHLLLHDTLDLTIRFFLNFFKKYTIWILLLFFLFYIIGYLRIRRIIRKYFKEL